MDNLNPELIILVIVVVLIVIAAVGIFMGSRISGDKKRIKELESELKDARKDMELYRSEVNDHFRKTSDLFSNMTESYKAVYLHMVEGSQDLCTSDAGLLKGANSDFLKVVHEEGAESPDEHVVQEDQVAQEPDTEVEVAEEPEPLGEEDVIPAQVEAENLEDAEADVAAEDPPIFIEEETAEEAVGDTDPAEEPGEKKHGLPADRAVGQQG